MSSMINRSNICVFFLIYALLFVLLFTSIAFFPKPSKGCYDFRCNWKQINQSKCYSVILNNTVTNCQQCFPPDVLYPLNESSNCFNLFGNNYFNDTNMLTCPNIRPCSNASRFASIAIYEIIVIVLFCVTCPCFCYIGFRVPQDVEMYEKTPFYVN